jgi:hypothetical protein
MPSVFDVLKGDKPEDNNYEEWGGQFACQERGCDGWANIARYVRVKQVLGWKCQHGHFSSMEYSD